MSEPLKAELEINMSSFSFVCRLFQSLAAAAWNDDRPNTVFVLGTLNRTIVVSIRCSSQQGTRSKNFVNENEPIGIRISVQRWLTNRRILNSEVFV